MSVEYQLSAILLPARPICNKIIHINIEGIAAVDGSVMSGPIVARYTTCLEPLYSNSMRVRLLAGEFLIDVPDDTIDLLIWHFSKDADMKNYCPDVAAVYADRYRAYVSRYVTAATIVALLSGTSVNGELQKRLGDLSVRRNRSAEELLNLMRDELMYLCALLEDGGNWGRHMRTVSKASGHQDAPLLSRQFARPDIYDSPGIPAANTRAPFSRRSDSALQTRWKRTWGRR